MSLPPAPCPLPPRPRWRVLAVDVAEQHPSETIYRVRVRSSEHMEPTYVFFVSQPPSRTDVPHDVGATVELDARLLDREDG